MTLVEIFLKMSTPFMLAAKIRIHLVKNTYINFFKSQVFRNKNRLFAIRKISYQSTEPYRPMVDIATGPFPKMFGYTPAPNMSMRRL